MRKTKTTQNTVTTPTNPEWVTKPTESLAGRIGDLSSIDPKSLVAPLSQRETDAFARTDSLGIDNDWFNRTLNADAPQVQSASLLDGLDKYMSPYRRDVVDSALADFDFGAGQTRAQQDLDMAGAGAFGGSGAALTKSMTEDALTRGRASTAATLYDQMFNTGASLSNQDAGRRQSASEANAQLMRQKLGLDADLQFGRDANERANIASQAGAGAIEREVDQQGRMAPYTALGAESSLLSSLPLNLFQGQTSNSTATSKTSDPMGALGSLAMLAAAPLSGGTSLLGMLGAGAGGGGLSALLGAANATAAARR